MTTHINDTFIEYDGHVFNETLLREFNYTIWANGTLSNSSHCYLVFGIYDAVFLPNGSAVNGTNCETPVKPIATRAGLGIAFGCLFALMIIFALSSLTKHGRNYLPQERRFRLVSRRWPWYWLIVAAACGVVSGFTSIDVDRDYLQGTALILQNVFYYVTLPAMLGSVWEMTRHWGSLCERILVDEDPWMFPDEDRRSKIEFYLPLVFYLFGFLTFFLSVLRSWTPIPHYSWSSVHTFSKNSATDPRFKASAFFALLAWSVIVASVATSLRYYSTARPIPWKVPLCLVIIFIRVAYNIAVAFEYDVGPLKFDTPEAYIYALGYLPVLLCMLVMAVAAWRETNDDLLIKELRREREIKTDFELGISRRRPMGTELKSMNTNSATKSTTQSGFSGSML